MSILYVSVVREPGDAPGSYPFTVCIRDSRGNVVLSRSFVYDSTEDVKTYAVNVDSLREGVYRVDIYNWNDCNPPSGVTTFRYWLHRITSGAYLSFDGWDYSRMFVFIMYVYDGKLFWQHLINTSDVIVPSNVPVHIEASDVSGNGFVGTVRGSGVVYVRPNTRVPFMAVFRIRYRDPVSRDVVSAFSGFLWMMRSTYVNLVDDRTVEIGIVKIEPGVSWLAAAVIVVAAVGGFAAWRWSQVRVEEVRVEEKKIETAKPLIDAMTSAYRNFENELSMCSPGDFNCVANVQKMWMPVLNTLSSNVGMLMCAGIPLRSCDGVSVGGVCVPWWVVAVAVFIAGLLVISALK
jgi:hypothetical protein